MPQNRLLQFLRDLWEPDALPIRETTQQIPVNPYGVSKMMVERILSHYAHPRARFHCSQIFQRKRRRSRRATERIARPGDAPDGSPIRDSVSHVAALRRLLAGRSWGAFNIGTGRGYSVKVVLDAIAAKTGQRLMIMNGLRRPGDPAVLVADASLARSEVRFVIARLRVDSSYVMPGR